MENKQTIDHQKSDKKKKRNDEDSLIAFSKSRVGLYKKASELCTLYGADIGVVVFPPTGKPISFSHPNMESIANRFLNHNPQSNNNASLLFEAQCRARVNELNKRLNDLKTRADTEKMREKLLHHNARARGNRNWLDASIRDGLNKEEVDKLIARLLEVQLKLCYRGNQLSGMGDSSSSSARESYPGTTEPS